MTEHDKETVGGFSTKGWSVEEPPADASADVITAWGVWSEDKLKSEGLDLDKRVKEAKASHLKAQERYARSQRIEPPAPAKRGEGHAILDRYDSAPYDHGEYLRAKKIRQRVREGTIVMSESELSLLKSKMVEHIPVCDKKVCNQAIPLGQVYSIDLSGIQPKVDPAVEIAKRLVNVFPGK